MKNLKKMSVKFYLMLALSAVAVLAGCKDDEEVVTPQFPDLKEQTVTLTETTDENGNNVFSASLDITFSANLDWTLKSDAAWCRFVNGEFKETTASGKAGDQTLKVEISDESWNYTSDDVAQITLQMGETNEVIYKLVRTRRPFTDVVVSDSEGNVYDAEHPIVIKGGRPSDPSYIEITVTSDFQIGVLAEELPDWVLLEAGDENGTYSLAFNENSETENIKYPISIERGFSIPFAVNYNGEIISASIPVTYEGLDSEYLSFSPSYVSMHNVSRDGKTITASGSTGSGNVTYEDKLETTILTRNDDYEIVKIVQKGDYMEYPGMDPVFTPTKYELDNGTNLEWVSVDKNLDKVSFTFTENRTEEYRAALVFVLPRQLYDEVKDNLMQLVDDATYTQFTNYTVLNVYQAAEDPAAPTVSFEGYIDMGEGSLSSFSSMLGEDIVMKNSEDPTGYSYVASISKEYFSYGTIYLKVLEYSSDMTIELSNQTNLEVSDIDGNKYVKINSSVVSEDKITVKNGDSVVAECTIMVY